MSIEISQIHRHLDPAGPVFTTFWTQHGTYPDHGVEWVAQAERFGIAYVAGSLVTEDLTWCGRCRIKPAWLLKVMEDYPERNVVWLDVDSGIKHVPPMSDDIDVGVVEVPRKAAKHGRFAAGLIQLKNTPAVYRMVWRWKRLNEAEPEDFSCDMKTLERAIHGEPLLKLDLLDTGYCHVPGVFEEPEKVLVYGKQASRVERNR